MIDLLADPYAWASLLTLTALEIVLGIDNVIFLSIVSARLPKHQQPMARRIGLGLALVARIVLLASLTWIIGLTAPAFQIFDFVVSWRDVILAAGGGFLLAKATIEVHHMLESEDDGGTGAATAAFGVVLAQIVALDIVFSLDSVLTAIGMAEHLSIMIIAVVISMIIMLVAAEPVSAFVNTHPTVKMLALSFLLLIGMTLIADGLHFHIPRGYLYFAIAFSAGVETMNQLVARRRNRKRMAAAENRSA